MITIFIMSWHNVNKSGKLYYTILIYDKPVNEIKNKLKDDLEKVNKRVKDSYKRKIINDRLYPLIKLLDTSYKDDEIINSIFLSGDELEKFDLSKEELSLCRKWKMNDFYITYDDKFKIGYLKNLFSEEKLNIIYELSNDNLKIIEMDKLKSRIIQQMKIENQSLFIDQYEKDKPKLIHGTGSFLKKIKNIDNIHLKKLNSENIINIINKLEIQNSQLILKMEVYDQLNNPQFEDKFLFGKKEISQGIMNYMIKKLYITPKLWRQLKNKVSSEYLNFKVLEIDTLENGDNGDKLIKDYNGLIALKYY